MSDEEKIRELVGDFALTPEQVEATRRAAQYSMEHDSSAINEAFRSREELHQTIKVAALTHNAFMELTHLLLDKVDDDATVAAVCLGISMNFVILMRLFDQEAPQILENISKSIILADSFENSMIAANGKSPFAPQEEE